MRRIALLALLLLLSCLPLSLQAADLALNKDQTMQLLTPTQVVMHRIVLDAPGVLMLQFRHELEADEEGSYWTVKLSDEQLKTVYELSILSNREEQDGARLRLPAGVYELQLRAGDYFSRESLTMKPVFQDESKVLSEREPNDTRPTATALEFNRVILGNTQSASDADYYRFLVEEAGLLVIQLEANRMATGHFWQVAMALEEEDESVIELDPIRHNSAEIPVQPGAYYLRIGALEEAEWNDADYRLTGRFQKQTAAAEDEVRELTLNEMTHLQPNGKTAQLFRFAFAAEERSADSLALRIQGDEAEAEETEEATQTWLLELFDDEGELSWLKSLPIGAGSYADLLTGLSEGEYTLKVQALEAEAEGSASFSFGLFQAEALPMSLLLHIGEPEMQVNGETVEIDPGYGTTPLILEGRTLLPIRSLVETLGGEVRWHAETDMVAIECGGHSIELTIGQAEAKVDLQSSELSVVPQIIEGRTMLPLRFISEALGCFVQWQAAEEAISIWY